MFDKKAYRQNYYIAKLKRGPAIALANYYLWRIKRYACEAAPPGFRFCSKCYSVRSESEFYSHKGSILKPCKACVQRKYKRKTVPSKVVNGKKYCAGCRQLLPAELFGVQSAIKSGLSSRCKGCMKTGRAGSARKRRRVERSVVTRRKKRESDPAYRLSWRMGRVLKKTLNGDKRGSSWPELVGYSIQELTAHWDRRYPGWQEIEKLHIHHIWPKNRFNFSSADDPEFKQCWAMENLMPLSGEAHRELHKFMGY